MTLALKPKTPLLVSSCSSKKVAKSFLARYFYSVRLSMAAVSAAVLMSSCANAQSTNSTAPALEGASGAAPPATPVLPRAESDPQPTPQDAAKPAPKYNPKDIERAFTFMDADRDGKISRQEASGFRNVAKHFDAADTNKDNQLSLEEFGNALNRP